MSDDPAVSEDLPGSNHVDDNAFDFDISRALFQFVSSADYKGPFLRKEDSEAINLCLHRYGRHSHLNDLNNLNNLNKSPAPNYLSSCNEIQFLGLGHIIAHLRQELKFLDWSDRPNLHRLLLLILGRYPQILMDWPKEFSRRLAGDPVIYDRYEEPLRGFLKVLPMGGSEASVARFDASSIDHVQKLDVLFQELGLWSLVYDQLQERDDFHPTRFVPSIRNSRQRRNSNETSASSFITSRSFVSKTSYYTARSKQSVPAPIAHSGTEE
jgi:hypothetical protein